VSDLSGLPPEVTSALIYSGPGATSYTTAASSWNAVSAELQSYALGVENVITDLSDQEWWGPSSTQVASAFGPYIQWAKDTATQAEQNGIQASEAAAAYEQVFGSVVPPPLIATNRVQLLNAVSTNVLGQNNGVISQLESQYNDFWAQNTSALNNYQTQSNNATSQLKAVKNAPEVATDTGQQSQAVSNASTLSSGTAQKTVNATTQATTQATTNATAAATSTNPLQEAWFLLTGQTIFPSNLATFVNGLSPFSGFAYNVEGLPYFSVGMGNSGVQIAKSTGQLGGAVAGAAAAAPKGLSGLGGMLGGGAAPSVAAGLGNAASIGKLAVPAAWNGALPGAVAHAAPIAVNTVSAVPEASGGAGNLLGGMPLAGMGTGGATGAGPRYGFRPTVMARPPFAG
ncbi:PPE family protein, partial [Mycobacterium rhizamassiliense]